jgi:hypothetical protein
LIDEGDSAEFILNTMCPEAQLNSSAVSGVLVGTQLNVARSTPGKKPGMFKND